MNKAHDELWKSTVRLRSQYNGKWSKRMAPLVTQFAKKYDVPFGTLRSRFIKQLTRKKSASHQAQYHSDASSLLVRMEKRRLFDWIEWMRPRYGAPRRDELRCQVLSVDSLHVK